MAMSNWQDLDGDDPLADMREAFQLPPSTIYLNGNSLGPLPVAAAARAREVVDQQWGNDLVSSWNRHHWIDLPQQCGEKIAPLIGAGPGQVICCDSISVNLVKLLAVCLSLRPGRPVVLSQKDNFPTDLYAVQGLASLLGEQRCCLQTVTDEELDVALNEEVAVLLLTQVNFRSGKVHDIQLRTEQAHARGALVIWDLAHSAGVMPLKLDAWQVDFALGCGYKYLNGGPGAPAFVYANKRHHEGLSQPLQGWMGHQAPFEFAEDYRSASGMQQFLTGTPAIVSMAILDAALDVFAELDMQQVYGKVQGLSEYFLELLKQSPGLSALKLESPRRSSERGGQLAFSHSHAHAMCQALAAAGVVVDFRQPCYLRFGLSPLFLCYEDIARAVAILEEIVDKQSYREERYQQLAKVT